MSNMAEAKELLKRYATARIPFIAINTIEKDRCLEMLREIAPWVESMRLLGQRGLQVLSMQSALEQQDSVGFVAHYRAQQRIEEKQKAIVSRDFEGSVVKAKPVVSGTVVTPWVNEEAARLAGEYKRHYAYGHEFFPRQVVEDGLYYIMYRGKYLTDVNAAADRTGDFPVFVAEADTINPQRQLWRIELVPATGRYKITNAQDGRYINELGTFWRDRSVNPFDAEWHTFVIEKTPDGYTFRCAGRAGSAFWHSADDRIGSGREGSAFQITRP